MKFSLRNIIRRRYAKCPAASCFLPITVPTGLSASFGLATSAGRDGSGRATVSYYNDVSHQLIYRLCDGLDCDAPILEQTVDGGAGT